MIPLPVYISAPPVPGLSAQYEDFRLEVGIWLGYGPDATLWENVSPGATAEVHRTLNEAYRWCLYPSTIPNEPVSHVWTFLEQDGTLTTVDGTYEYTVPADFGSMLSEELWWSSNQLSSLRVKRTSIDWIRRQRQYFQTTTSYSTHFTVVWNAPTLGEQQTQKIVLFPTPGLAAGLLYRYAINTEPLTATNPYPVGGQRMGQLLMEACRAIGEYKKDGVRGESWSVFRESLDSAIRMDRRTQTETTVGMMRSAPASFYDQYLGESQLYAMDDAGEFALVENV